MYISKILNNLTILFLIVFPFIPYRFLRFLYFVPVIVPASWIFTELIPVPRSNVTSADYESVTKSIYRRFNKNITEQGTSNINAFVLVLIMLIIATRFRIKANRF